MDFESETESDHLIRAFAEMRKIACSHSMERSVIVFVVFVAACVFAAIDPYSSIIPLMFGLIMMASSDKRQKDTIEKIVGNNDHVWNIDGKVYNGKNDLN